jgi:hypothetical protein
MKIRLAALALAAATLAGCTTTEEANTVIQSRWIGQPAELVFSRYGPPVSEFRTGTGNTIYTWRGGEKTQYIPAQYSTPAEQPVYGKTVTKTTSREKEPGVTVTKTTTSSMGVYVPQQPQMISPARVEELFCEVQITVDATDRIRAIPTRRAKASACHVAPRFSTPRSKADFSRHLDGAAFRRRCRNCRSRRRKGSGIVLFWCAYFRHTKIAAEPD